MHVLKNGWRYGAQDYALKFQIGKGRIEQSSVENGKRKERRLRDMRRALSRSLKL